MIYAANSIYSMIPKNACSTLRLSIALANGAIDDPHDWRWIHKNNNTFSPALRELATPRYAFAILRCPYARLVSCFLDKFVSRRPDAWHFHELIDESIEIPRLTFRRFCQELTKPHIRHTNIHWRPQVDFLVYKSYDDLFCVEDMDTATATLEEKIGLRLIDSRPYVRHDTSRLKSMPGTKSFADTEVWQIEAMMMNDLRPDPLSLYDEEIRDMVAESYQEDMRLFCCLFEDLGLFNRGRKEMVA